MHLNSPTSEAAIRRSKRDSAILAEREAGATLEQLASKYDLSVNGVWHVLRRHVKKVPQRAAMSLQERQLADLQALREKLLPLIDQGDLEACRILILASKREGQIAGTDAPARTDARLLVASQDAAAADTVSEQLQATLKDPVSRLLSCMLMERHAAEPLSRESVEASLRALAMAYVDFPAAPTCEGLSSKPGSVVDGELAGVREVDAQPAAAGQIVVAAPSEIMSGQPNEHISSPG